MQQQQGWERPVIGLALANVTAHLLDHTLCPLPIGVAGELYLGGAGVARGSLSRPALTAERFLPAPFAAEPGARLYRTGDVARRGERGELEYVGRADRQGEGGGDRGGVGGGGGAL